MGAPYVRSQKKKISTMLELARITPGETALDLGSGDGSLVIEAARQGANATGIEINPFLIWYSRQRIRRAGVTKNARVARANLFKYPCTDTNVIFIYLWPETLVRLEKKLEHELSPGSRIISNGFPISGWNPILVKDEVYLYEIKSL